MTARKKSLRKQTKNHYGNPILLAREDIGSLVIAGDEYNEINVMSTLATCTITVRNTKLPFLQRPVSWEVSFNWTWYDWLHNPQCAQTLSVQTEKLIQAFVEHRSPEKLKLRPVNFPSVLV